MNTRSSARVAARYHNGMRALLFTVGIVMGLAFSASVAAAWTGPAGSPPNNNVSAPLNVGTTAQDKNGNIGVNGLAVFGNSLLGGSVGSNAYLNFGGTSGTGGYGIWDNNGTLEFKNSGGSWASLQGTIYNYCSGTGSCGSGGTISGSGSTNYVPRWTGATALGNSSISDDGSSATANGNFFVDGYLYDGQNTGYYLKPSGWSNLNTAIFASGPYTNDWFRVNTTGGLYWQNYGGSVQQYDGSWVRVNPNMYTNGGYDSGGASGAGCGGALGGGYTFRVCGTAQVTSNLTVSGTIKSGQNRFNNVTQSTLQGYGQPGCNLSNSSTWWYCNAACDNMCSANGYSGGVITQGSPSGATCVCIP